MPIDTSIYNALLQKPKTIQEYDNEAQTGQMNRLALQAEQNKAADYQRGLAGEAALSKALASGGDVTNALAQGGFGSKALAYTQQLAAQRKTAAEATHLDAQTGDLTQKTAAGKYDLERKKHDVALQEVTSFNTPADAVASLNAHIAKGEMSQEEGAQMRQMIPADPAQFRQWQMQTVQSLLSAKDRMEYIAPTANTVANNQTSVANTAATNATSRANNASANATTQRGQNMTDARTRESTAATAAAGKVPSGYRANPDGSLSFIPGGPADPAAGGGKPPTEFQGKSAAFGARAEQADKLISGLTGKYSPAAVNAKQSVEGTPLVGGILGAVTNKYALNDSDQKAEQAQRDFVNALLRQESGAAISQGEFENAKRQYFPQPGDGKEVIAQKDANRKLAIKGFQNSAGKAAFSAPAPAGDIHAQADAILNGGK